MLLILAERMMRVTYEPRSKWPSSPRVSRNRYLGVYWLDSRRGFSFCFVPR